MPPLVSGSFRAVGAERGHLQRGPAILHAQQDRAVGHVIRGRGASIGDARLASDGCIAAGDDDADVVITVSVVA